MPATSAKKPVQVPLIDADAEPRARPEEWLLDGPPARVGTLPREVYQALCVLRAYGPCDAEALGSFIARLYDWDLMRITRVVTKLANCGYVTTDENGVLMAREETR